MRIWRVADDPATLSGATEPEGPPTYRVEPVGRGLKLNLRELWHYRELALFLVWREIKVRYKQTAIGVLWAVLQPFLTMVVFTLFFGRLANLPSEGLPYPVFYFAGLVLWTYFSTSLNTATGIMVEQQQVITRVYFPRILLPISASLSGLVDLAIASTLLFGISFAFEITPKATAPLMLVFVILVVIAAMGVSFWISALNALYRDFRYAVPLLVQLWLFASPIAYASSLVPERWRTVYALNPLVPFLDGFRWSLTGAGSAPSASSLAISSSIVAAIFVGGLMFFNRKEAVVVDVV